MVAKTIERPIQYRYTTSHEWVRSDGGNILVIGVTDVFLKPLKDIKWIYYPELEENLIKGRPFSEIEGEEGLADVTSPINGEVIELNEMILNNLDLISKNSFDDRWLVRLRVEDPGQIDDLLSLKAYEKHLASGR